MPNGPGHALNKILKDIINRFHVSIGDRVQSVKRVPCIEKLIRACTDSYFPGWDCHGLPIENKALQDLKVRLASSSQKSYPLQPFLCFSQQDSHSLPVSTIRDAARKTAEREMKVQMEEFEKFGIMADWSKESTYRTLGNGFLGRLSSRSHGMFSRSPVRNATTFCFPANGIQRFIPLCHVNTCRLADEFRSPGLIYRDYRPVYFSPSSRSALAEAELVYKDDHISHSVYVTFVLDPAHSDIFEGTGLSEITQAMQKETIRLLVWTTTPWTLSANMVRRRIIT